MEMITVYCVSSLLGILFGIFTGIIPGIHVNTIVPILIGVSASHIFPGIDIRALIFFLVSLAISHTFFDYIPGLFLGIPGDGAFALLPGEAMVMRGEGLEALYLSAKGSLYGLLWASLLASFFLSAKMLLDADFVKNFYEIISDNMFAILVVISILLIMTDKHKLWALFVFMSSGIFGILSFATPLVPGGASTFNVIFPALSGVFGVSVLLLSLFESSSSIPFQKEPKENMLTKKQVQTASITGMISGSIVGLIPGLGSANAAALFDVVKSWMVKRNDSSTVQEPLYIVTTSSLNTADGIFAILALYFIHKSRSGASIGIERLLNTEITSDFAVAIISVMVISGIISFFVMKRIGAPIGKLVSLANYHGLSLAVITFLLVLICLTTGFGGVLILVCGSLIGMIPPVVAVRRSQAMGFFLIPTMLFFSGYQAEVVSLMRFEAKINPSRIIGIYDLGLFILLSFVAGLISYVGNHYFFKSGVLRIWGMIVIASILILSTNYIFQFELLKFFEYFS